MLKRLMLIYESFMFILVIASLFFAFSESGNYVIFDRMIWLIFVIDYFTRLFISKNKWSYIKSHPLELIAIIPLDSFFRAARFVRLFRVLRLLGIGARYLKPVYAILKTNGLDKLMIITMILLFIIPIPIIAVEPAINTFPDALWWAIVTTTTVGYGDISPTTPLGRVLAVLLMIVGIGIIGTFTSAITNYFSSRKDASHDEYLKEIIHAIEKTDHLTDTDVELIQLYMKRKMDAKEIPDDLKG